MTIITLPYSAPAHPHLRRLDLRRDLGKVADLVQACFSNTLDQDGLRYLSHLRSAASAPLARWAAVSDPSLRQMSGFVWEQDGQIVGNLSLYPVPQTQGKIYLIANVAVHPDHRRSGIARQLTQAAVEEVKRHPGARVWLHVRSDNPAAAALYQGEGFRERSVRTTWRWDDSTPVKPTGNLRVGTRRGKDWPQQQRWMEALHPSELRWYFSLSLDAFQSGIAGWVRRLFSEFHIMQWSARSQGELVGVLSWHSTFASADRLWLAADPENEDQVIHGLIPAAIAGLRTWRPLVLEYPAGRAENAFKDIGFQPQQTLSWMLYQPG